MSMLGFRAWGGSGSRVEGLGLRVSGRVNHSLQTGVAVRLYSSSRASLEL